MNTIQSAYNLQDTINMPDNSIGATTKTCTKNNPAIMHTCIKAIGKPKSNRICVTPNSASDP